MLYRAYHPRPPLADFVETLWLYEGDPPLHTKERRLPTGTMELVINLRDNALHVSDWQRPDQFQRFRGSLLCGAYAECFVIDTASLASVIGVQFRPGGAFPFVRMPAGELHNTHVSLDTLWGTSASDLREQLLAAATPEARFRLLEQSLLAQVARPLAGHPAVACALQAFQQVPHLRTIADVSGQIGLSQRRFIDVFREAVGLTPKQFCRVRRFQHALRLIEQGQHVEWTALALTCGYYDQAHFIHDFQAFAGLTPTAYLARRSEHRNHVPLRD